MFTRIQLLDRLKHWTMLSGLCVLTVFAAWMSLQTHTRFDWTLNARNTLSDASRQLLDQMPGEIVVTVYATPKQSTRAGITAMLARYQQHKANFTVSYVDPKSAPEAARQLGIRNTGEMRIEYAQMAKNVQVVSEQTISNTLLTLTQSTQRWIAFTTGHGERNLVGQANHDLGEFSKYMAKRGFRMQPLSLTEVAEVPTNTALLVVADPRTHFLASETAALRAYLDKGGNLLVLAEPASAQFVEPLLAHWRLNISDHPIIDPRATEFGVADTSVSVITAFSPHAITDNFDLISVFPQAGALTVSPIASWSSRPVVETSSDSYEAPADDPSGTPNASPGSKSIVLSLHRTLEQQTREQRVLISGDSDFLSNTYLANGGNLDLGLRMFEWLAADDAYVAIPVTRALDSSFHLSKQAAMVLAFTSLFGIPIALIAAGVSIWWWRQRRAN